MMSHDLLLQLSRQGIALALSLGVVGLASICPQELRGQESAGTLRQATAAERQVAIIQGYKTLRDAETLFAAGDYAEALAEYRKIIAQFPAPSPAAANLQNAAYDGAAASLVRLAWQDIDEGRLDEARNRAREARAFAPADAQIEAEYRALYARMGIPLDPEGEPAIEDNPAITPGYLKDVQDVRLLLAEGDELFESGQFDAATRRYEQIITIDPFNSTARKRMQKVLKHKHHFAEKAQDTAREQALAAADMRWQYPVLKEVVPGETLEGTDTLLRSPTQGTEARLRQIVLDRVLFEQASIGDIIRFLQNEFRSRDQQPERPISFVPKGDLPETEITLELLDVSMLDVIKYAAQVGNLKFRIEESLVVFLPLTSTDDTFISKEYRIGPDFFQVSVTDTETAGLGGRGTRGSRGGSTLREGFMVESERDVKKVLESRGVEFPQGSKVVYSPSSGKLLVRNTPENIELIDLLVQGSQDPSSKVQVEIEAKLIEINQTDLDELSVAMNFAKQGNYTVPRPPLGHYSMDGLNNLDGLRTSSELRRNSLDSLIGQDLTGNADAFTAPQPNAFNFTLIMAHYNVDIMIRALMQKKSVDLVTAPKIVTRSSESAVIRVIRKFSYPTQFDPPELPTTQSGDSVGQNIAPPVVTPVRPSSFEEKDIGVILNVTPQVGPDNYTVELQLVPEVLDFEGFINYGEPIVVPDGNRTFTLTDNVVNQPVFNSRKIETSVQVYDGQTVVLGGLIREDIQKIDDKVPVLGDIPVLGRLFRSKVEQAIKRNLVIFVTPRLITPTGELVNTPEQTALNNEGVAP